MLRRVAIYEIGCFFGSLFVLFAGEKLGRRRCIWLGCLVLSIGGALQAAAYGIPQMIVGRIVAGLGNGINTSTIRKLTQLSKLSLVRLLMITATAVWHSELMKAHKRGKGLSIELAINIFGVMTAYWVDYGMSFVNSQAQFRFPLALQILFALVTFTAVIFLPESPRWLVAHDRHDEARVVLSNLRTAEDDHSDAALASDLAIIKHAIDEERAAAGTATGFRALLKDGPQKFRYRTLLGIGGQFMQQLSGINLIT